MEHSACNVRSKAQTMRVKDSLYSLPRWRLKMFGWPEVGFWEVCGVHEFGKSHLVLAASASAAEPPQHRLDCRNQAITRFDLGTCLRRGPRHAIPHPSCCIRFLRQELGVSTDRFQFVFP